MTWSSTRSEVMGRKVARPTTSSTRATTTPRRARSSSTAGVRCSPAVGAAAEAGRSGEDGLVALGVGQRSGQVGRQGHLADPVEHAGDVDPGQEPEVPPPLPHPFDGLDHQALAHEHVTGAQAPAGSDQGLPRALVDRFEQQGLHGATGAAPAQAQAGGQDAGVVDDDQVTGFAQLGQVGHGVIGGAQARSPVHQQAGAVTGFDGLLGDALGG